MAEYVTLKKPDGTIIYPQSVIAQVADGSISSDQIDFSTFTNTYAHDSTNTTDKYPNTWTNKLSVTVPQSGTYRVEGLVQAITAGVAILWYAQAKILIGTSAPSVFPTYFETLIPGSTNMYADGNVHIAGTLDLTAGQTVYLSIKATENNNACKYSYCDLFIQRIS